MKLHEQEDKTLPPWRDDVHVFKTRGAWGWAFYIDEMGNRGGAWSVPRLRQLQAP